MVRRFGTTLLALFLSMLAFSTAGISPVTADETCNSPYMANLIKGQEDYLYVWALGVEGVGDGSDKLVTIDVNPTSGQYGRVIGSVSVGAAAKRITWASPMTADSSGPAASMIAASTSST